MNTAPHAVHGAIRDHWADLGWEQSSLGYPVSGTHAVDGVLRVDFQGGYIRLDSATGETEAVET